MSHEVMMSDLTPLKAWKVFSLLGALKMTAFSTWYHALLLSDAAFYCCLLVRVTGSSEIMNL